MHEHHVGVLGMHPVKAIPDEAMVVKLDPTREGDLGARGARTSFSARRELEEITEGRVHLFLFVKVRENWSDDPERYREMGLEFPR